MKLGLGSYAFAWAIGIPGHRPSRPMDARGLLAEARRLGVRVVQICDNLPLHHLTGAELADIEAEARDSGIAVEVGTRGLRMEGMREYLRLAVRFGSPFVRIVVDSPGDEPPPDEVVARLRRLIPEYHDAGVRIAIENHDRFRCQTLVSILDRAGPEQVGICLDTVNSFGALEGPEVVVRTLAPHTLSLHVKDFTIARVDSMLGFVVTGSPAGEGRLDLPWLFKSLQAAGREVNAILETWPPLGPTPEATVARERDWAERSVRHLRSVIPD
ncbi:MAG: sugar phosphate isomerase/epimerase [Verrucomicrobiales bacterium]|nr:sugar phosphate isomerase/epimerase [Verrucomicrobiales bacterium]